jgi:NAD-dependent SIR2 family protein deacetylase
MSSIQTPLQKAETEIAEAEYILIGAGSGLSTAAGINYAGPEFEAAFKDMIARYGFTDLYTSSFYPFRTEEERWAYWSRHIDYARFAPPALPLYKRLLEMVQGKEYFVITTNVDGQFVKAGFDPDKVFEVQGDYGLMQCATACHSKRYSNESLVKQMVVQQKDCRVPSGLVPNCPVCGGPMEINVRKDRFFVEDERWKELSTRYFDFVNEAREKKLVLLEYGVGFNTPVIIRYPFERMAAEFPQTTLIRINKDYPECQTPGIKNSIPLTSLMV